MALFHNQRAGGRLHLKRDGRRQSHISPLADIRFRLFGLEGEDPSRHQAGSTPGVDVMLVLQTISKAQDVMCALSGEAEDVQSMCVQWTDVHKPVENVQQRESGLVVSDKQIHLCVLRLEEFKFIFPAPIDLVIRRDRVVANLWREHRPLVQDFLALSRSVI